MTARPWTAAERYDALRWYAGGMRVENIAHALGRTTNAVRHLMTARGVTRRRVPDLPVTAEEAAAARATLRVEIELARAERGSAAPFKPPGPLQW